MREYWNENPVIKPVSKHKTKRKIKEMKKDINFCSKCGTGYKISNGDSEKYLRSEIEDFTFELIYICKNEDCTVDSEHNKGTPKDFRSK